MNLLPTPLPSIIQGGMGIGVSDWRLARAVSLTGQLGVVSGTALGTVLARRLQMGDPEGLIREALSACPLTDCVNEILKRFFVSEGKASKAAFRAAPLPNIGQTLATKLNVVGNFVEVHLAKRGHSGLLGLNLLEKIQAPTLASLYGAMLAGVDCVLMGAGIPRSIPRVLDSLAEGLTTDLKMNVVGAKPEDDFTDRFDPADFGCVEKRLKRPAFIGIVASNALAKTLATRAESSVEGLIIEGPPAGGHNAPPRGPLQLNEQGEPIFGERDVADIEKIRELGLPFWLAGSFGRPGRLSEAKSLGAAGIQVGTAFAFCDESGLRREYKLATIEKSRRNSVKVFTDPKASPTGFPFKVLEAEGTISDEAVYANRERKCDLGYLRTAYRKDDGSLGYRCPAEPIKDYVRKGGKEEDSIGRKCVCNGLMSAIGLEQYHNEIPEPTLLTAGEDAARIAEFLPEGKDSYSASDVIHTLLA